MTEQVSICEEIGEHRGEREIEGYPGYWECTVCGAEGYPEDDDEAGGEETERSHDSLCCLDEDHVGACHSSDGYVLS